LIFGLMMIRYIIIACVVTFYFKKNITEAVKIFRSSKTYSSLIIGAENFVSLIAEKRVWFVLPNKLIM